MSDQEAAKGFIYNLDGYFYSDPAIYAKEQARIFHKTWQLFGSAAPLSKSGAYAAKTIAGIAVFAQRGSDGVLRAFENVCAHRGSRIVGEGSGKCDLLQCPYHGWSYTHDGQLHDTPWFGESSPFNKKDLHLQEISVEVWRGLLFVALFPSVELSEQLGDLPQDLVKFPMESYLPVATKTFQANVNWKTYLDQFDEFYHVPFVHNPDKATGMRDYEATPLRKMMRMSAPQGPASDAAYYGGKWVWAWPNWTISFFPGGMKTSWVNPTGAREIQVDFEFYFADVSSAGSTTRAQVISATESIFLEDIAACARAQANYDSGRYRPGPLHPRLEQATAYFQSLVRGALLDS